MRIHARQSYIHIMTTLVMLLTIGELKSEELHAPVVSKNTILKDILTIEQAIHEAKTNNPNIAAMQARAQAYMHMPERAGSLDDPLLSLNFANFPLDDFGTGNDPMTQIQLAVSQSLPYPGKLELRKTVALANAQATEIDVTETVLQLIRQVKQTWWQVFYINHAIETVHRNKMLLRQLVEIAQTKYQVGKGIQQDVLLAQLELSKLLDKEIQLQESRNNTQSQMNALLNRPVLAPVVLPNSVNIQMSKVMSESQLQQLARASRPLIKAAQKRIHSTKQNLQLAKREQYPDFRITAVYAQREQRSDLASLQLGVNLPVFSATKQKKLVDQRKSEMLQANYGLEDLFVQLDREISIALSKFRSASEQAALFKGGIIPQAQQTVDAMRAGYQVNQVDFLNLVRTQVTLYDYETQYWLAISLAHQALAQLESLVGQESIYE